MVKPYLHLATDVDGKPVVKFELVDGHDQHRPSYKNVVNWINELGISKLRKFFQVNQPKL